MFRQAVGWRCSSGSGQSFGHLGQLEPPGLRPIELVEDVGELPGQLEGALVVAGDILESSGQERLALLEFRDGTGE